MMACMFRTNPLKCVPICVPKMESGVPKVTRWCALDSFPESGEITFFMGTQGG
jgi:hypothetical protein